MKSPVDVVRGQIVDIDERNGVVTIKARYDDWNTLIKRGYREAYIEMVDSRPLSDKQRRMCWALFGEIAEWQGQSRSETVKDMVSEARKLDFMINELGENGDRLFSLSNAPMSLIAAFQRYLVRFVVVNNIPTKKSMLEYVEDTGDYVHACLMAKKCVISGRPAQLHHIDRVGMGRDRHDICHEGMEVLPLSPEHHMEAHSMSDADFFDKYHLDGGVLLDQTLCRIWKLSRRKKDA